MSTTAKGNFIAEWFGYRVYPVVRQSKVALRDQAEGRCPFLSKASGAPTQCVKPLSSQGVCTISSASNGPRQDWLVCPNRVLGSSIIELAARQLFRLSEQARLHVVPAPTMRSTRAQERAAKAMAQSETFLVFFQEKLGGEISLPATKRSPEMAFDITLVEIVRKSGVYQVGRFGVLEVQTMDFHGTYRNAVKNAKDALRLHGAGFYKAIRDNPTWLAEKIEGPNKANVFKRTFYQLVFKFRLGQAPDCAGSMLAVPAAVWDSWVPHLGMPPLKRLEGTQFTLAEPNKTPRTSAQREACARILVFEPDASSRACSNPLKIKKTILTSAEALMHYALRVAPEAAVGERGLVDNLSQRIRARLQNWWPVFLP